MQEENSRNLIIATVLSVVVMGVWTFFFAPEAPDEGARSETETTETAVSTSSPSETQVAPTPLSRDEMLSTGERIKIDTPRVSGSIALEGGRIDDLVLKNYKETQDSNSDFVHLLDPKGAENAAYAQTGFKAVEETKPEDVPTLGAVWVLKSGDVLAPGRPVILEWTSPSGLVFERQFDVDENYMFKLTESVTNNMPSSAWVQPLALVSRKGKPDARSTYILHEGGLLNVDGKIEEVSFKEMAKGEDVTGVPGVYATQIETQESGWSGITTKYWMTTIIPQKDNRYSSVLRYSEDLDVYTVETYFEAKQIEPGQKLGHETRFFLGAKEVKLIREYEKQGVDRFVDSVDWGWFYFLTKPIFNLLNWLHGLIGNMGFAIIALTFVIKAIMFPIAYRSQVAMSKMKKLQPKIEEIKALAGDDKVKLQQLTMEMYRKEKVNPVSGCLPILLQIPVFFSLYKVLYVTIELRQASFLGPWIDLSQRDPTSIFNLFGLLPWAGPSPESFLATVFLGILPILLGISMWLTQKLNPTPSDPTQATIFAIMPWMFMFMMGNFASGLVLYWITNNALTFIQQYTIMRTQGVKPDLLGNILGGKKIPEKT